MKYVPLIALLLFCYSCGSNKDSQEGIEMLHPESGMTAESIAAKAAIVDIETKNLELAGETNIAIQIEGMELIKISRKDFLLEEKAAQKESFAGYMKYLDRFKGTNKSINNPNIIAENRAKHNAVINYLDQLIAKSSSTDKVYKVVYRVKATTKVRSYNQVKTTYLDEDYKKLTVSYVHLKPEY